MVMTSLTPFFVLRPICCDRRGGGVRSGHKEKKGSDGNKQQADRETENHLRI